MTELVSARKDPEIAKYVRAELSPLHSLMHAACSQYFQKPS